MRRIDLPHDDLLAITIHLPDEGAVECLVAALDEPAHGIGLVPSRPRGQPAGDFARKLRKEIGGARVRDLAPVPGGLRLELARREGPRALVLELGGDRGNAILLNDGDVIVAALRVEDLRRRELAPGRGYAPPTTAHEPAIDTSRAAMRQAGQALLAAHHGGRLDARKRAVRRALSRAQRRLGRRLKAIEADADRAERAPGLRATASMIVQNLYRIGPRDHELTATDWEADPPAERSIEIDPAIGAKAQADRLFHQARRLERGAEIATDRWARTTKLQEATRALQQELEDAGALETIEAIAERGRELGLRELERASEAQPGARRRGNERRKPYRSFEGSGGRRIMVGRGAADNDALTLRHARPHDLWLHARGQRGAHVIVPLEKGEACPPELLVDAATLAACFSDARGEETVEVQHTPRRFVRKPRGAAPGAVLVDRERVMLLRVEPDRLERLLGREG